MGCPGGIGGINQLHQWTIWERDYVHSVSLAHDDEIVFMSGLLTARQWDDR